MTTNVALPSNLDDWLAHLLAVHPRGVDMGLERVAAVAQRLGVQQPAPCCIVVGGTNGKGSVVTAIEAVLRAAGRRAGATISPHLVRFNERIRIDGVDIDDATVCSAFAAIEAARADITLSYFEFAMLAALWCFRQASVEVAVIEVGLGGRLDAANIVDADVAIVASVGIDHVDYLGPDRTSIGWDKAHIARRDRPFVVGDDDPPASLLEVATNIGARVLRREREFAVTRDAVGLHYRGLAVQLDLAATTALYPENIACALAALESIDALPPAQIVAQGLANAVNPARLQRSASDPRVIIDVAHNPHAALRLVRELTATRSAAGTPKATHVVFGALADKDHAGIVQALAPIADQFWFVDTQGARGVAASVLSTDLAALALEREPLASCHATVGDALRLAQAAAAPTDRIVVCGCFQVAAAALREIAGSTAPTHPGERFDNATVRVAR